MAQERCSFVNLKTSFSLHRSFIVTAVSFLLTALLLFSSCSTQSRKPEDSGEEGSSSQSTELENSEDDATLATQGTVDQHILQPTEEQAAKHNLTIQEQDITLLQLEKAQAGDPLALLHTSLGTMVFRLFPTEAPLAVENFILLAEQDYFNGQSFDTVMENFYLESGKPRQGQPTSIYTNEEGTPIPFVTEASLNLWNFHGALVMKTQDSNRPHTNTSEFRIIQASLIGEETLEEMEKINYPKKVIETYQELGGIPGFDGRCTVFGQLQEGATVMNQIAYGEVDASFQPIKPILIDSVEIIYHDGVTESYTESASSATLDGEPEDTENTEETENTSATN